MHNGYVRAEHLVAIPVIFLPFLREIFIQQLGILVPLYKLCADVAFGVIVDLCGLVMPDCLLDRGVYDGFYQFIEGSGRECALPSGNLLIEPIVVSACIVHHGFHGNGWVTVLHHPKHFVICGAAWPCGRNEVICLRHGLSPEPIGPIAVVLN